MSIEGSAALALAAIASAFLLSRGGRSRPHPRNPPGARAGQVWLRNTGEGSPRRWAQLRTSLVESYLASGDGGVPWADVPRVARAVVAHWGLETGLGRNEDNGNVGNIAWYATSPTQWFLRGNRRWRAYPSVAAGATDYLRLVRAERYAPAWQQLLAGATPGQYAAALVNLGYTEPRSAAERIGNSVDSVAREVERLLAQTPEVEAS